MVAYISYNSFNMLFQKEDGSLFSRGALSSDLDFFTLLVGFERVMLWI